MDLKNTIRIPAEKLYEKELNALIENESEKIPKGWRMSPYSVLKYITGGRAENQQITPKYIGSKRIVEIAVSTLLTDRALLLIGEPGTAKSWLSENLAAAIYGNSGLVVQGTAGTTEEQIKYTWNYALLISRGPSNEALVKSPLYTAMETGGIARFEEITRCASEVQDSLISILSEKRIAIPELGSEIAAQKGFSVIATANTRDRGVNDMSSALKRRFNTVLLPVPNDIRTEMDIVSQKVASLSDNLEIGSHKPDEDIIYKVVTIFREIRNGQTEDGKEKIKTPSSVMSTAEAISLLINSMALAESFGNGKISDDDIAAGLQGAVVKDNEKDTIVWREYLENVMKRRGSDWRGLYNACMEMIK